ncbi:serine/threonine-protein kinase, partial [Singulisphaera rosea]
HPGVVPVYGLGRYADGRPYYAMRFIEGETLRSAIDRFHSSDKAEAHGPGRDLEFRKLLGCLIDVCNAVAYAHSRGVVHRDLTPANILYEREGMPKITDFGLAKLLDSESDDSGEIPLTGTGTVLGTAQYMAPEQVLGASLDQRCDLYALGGVAYTLITGRPPFDGESPASVMISVTRDAVVPPSRLRPDVPNDLEHLIMTCLAKDPNSRPSSAEEVGQALARCRSSAEWDASAAATWWHEREANASRKASL